MAENKVTFGLQDLHIAPWTALSTATAPAYEAPIPVPGAVRFTPTTVGDTTSFYADNRAYFTVTTNNGYTFEIEIAKLPDALAAELLGWAIDDNGALVETTDGIAKHFALLAQVQGDVQNRRFVYYDCQVSRPAKERTTKTETTDITGEVLAGTASPVIVGGKSFTRAEIERTTANATDYDAFFTAVYMPTFTEVPAGA